MKEPTSSSLPESAAFAPFRPRRGRVVALAVVGGSLILFGVLAALIPTSADAALWGLPDRLMFFSFGIAMAVLAWRYASLAAIPSHEGLVVRNLVVTRRLEWAQVVSIQFGGGQPWVSLDLADADTLAVMAIQRADGEFAEHEASRLAALIQALGERPEPQPGGDER
jgi:hypothetical protein